MDWRGVGDPVFAPKDFTPVCTTELGYMAKLEPDFAARNCKIVGLSVDPVSSHGKWAADIEETQGHSITYPMIGDPALNVAKLYNMLPADAGDSPSLLLLSNRHRSGWPRLPQARSAPSDREPARVAGWS
jgi:alkyl hydroperoxide reductase subunit AhpC